MAGIESPSIAGLRRHWFVRINLPHGRWEPVASERVPMLMCGRVLFATFLGALVGFDRE